MRIKLKLELDRNHRNVLPINNRYETSSFVYKTLNNTDSDFAKWLHDHGYRTSDGKAGFKFFTFSDFIIPKGKYQVVGDRMVLKCTHIYLTVSFYINNDGAKFIMGLFKNRKGEIGDLLNSIKFNVAEVTNEPEPQFSQTMNYRSISPIIMSEPIMRNGKLDHNYISPECDNYLSQLKQNIAKKADAQNIIVDTNNIELIPSTKLFRNAIKIAANTPRQTTVIGYKYYFTLKAEPAIHQLIYNGAIGELGSQGFGCIEVDDK